MDRRVLQVHLVVQLQQPHDVLIVVVGLGDPPLVDPAAQDRMGQRVAAGFHLAAGVGVVLGVLGRVDGVEHDREVTAGGVLHAGGHIKAAGGLAVVLVLDTAGADGHIAQKILHIAPVFGVEHLVRRGHAEFLDGAHKHPPHRDQAGLQVGAFLGVGLVGDALVPVAVGAGLVGVDAGHQHQLVRHLLLHAGQAADIFADGVLIVGRAGADDHQEFVRPAGDRRGDLGVPGRLDRPAVFRKGVPRPDLGRGRQFFQVGKAHLCFKTFLFPHIPAGPAGGWLPHHRLHRGQAPGGRRRAAGPPPGPGGRIYNNTKRHPALSIPAPAGVRAAGRAAPPAIP